MRVEKIIRVKSTTSRITSDGDRVDVISIYEKEINSKKDKEDVSDKIEFDKSGLSDDDSILSGDSDEVVDIYHELGEKVNSQTRFYQFIKEGTSKTPNNHNHYLADAVNDTVHVLFSTCDIVSEETAHVDSKVRPIWKTHSPVLLLEDSRRISSSEDTDAAKQPRHPEELEEKPAQKPKPPIKTIPTPSYPISKTVQPGIPTYFAPTLWKGNIKHVGQSAWHQSAWHQSLNKSNNHSTDQKLWKRLCNWFNKPSLNSTRLAARALVVAPIETKEHNMNIGGIKIKKPTDEVKPTIKIAEPPTGEISDPIDTLTKQEAKSEETVTGDYKFKSKASTSIEVNQSKRESVIISTFSISSAISRKLQTWWHLKINHDPLVLPMNSSISNHKNFKHRQAQLKLDNQKTSQEDPKHFKACLEIYNNLDDLFKGVKLYIDLRKRGALTHPHRLHIAKYWRKQRYDTEFTKEQICSLDGDGVTERSIPYFIDYEVIQRWSPLRHWSRESFEPIFMIPDLEGIIKVHDSRLILSMFAPILRIVKSQLFEDDRLKLSYQDVSSLQFLNSNRELLNLEYKSDERALAKMVILILNKYTSIFYQQHNRRRQVKDVELKINKKFLQLLDNIILGYFEAFHISTNLEFLNKFGSNEIYVQMFNFFQEQSFREHGYHLIQSLSRSLFELSGNCPLSPSSDGEKNSVEFLNDCFKAKNQIISRHELSFLLVMSSLLQSKQVYGFILRRLLFMVDQSENCTKNKEIWFLSRSKDTNDSLNVKIRKAVRDEILQSVYVKAASHSC